MKKTLAGYSSRKSDFYLERILARCILRELWLPDTQIIKRASATRSYRYKHVVVDTELHNAPLASIFRTSDRPAPLVRLRCFKSLLVSSTWNIVVTIIITSLFFDRSLGEVTKSQHFLVGTTWSELEQMITCQIK